MVINRSILKFLFLLLLMSTVGFVYAQKNLTIQVRNKDGAGLPGAGIELIKNTTALSHIQTDSLGNARITLSPAEKIIITVSHVGYISSSDTIHLQSDTTILVFLAEAQQQLNTVVVRGNRRMLESNAEKTTYNIEKSITAAGTDALQAISQIPGIRVNGDEISIAGKGTVRAMVNNRIIQLTGRDLSKFLRSISATEIEKIELVSLPPAKFDADGNAGLINIVLKRSLKEGLYGNLSLSGKKYLPGQSSIFGKSNFWELNTAANLSFVSGKWSAFMNVSLAGDRHLEGFETDIYYPTQHWQQKDSAMYTYRNININTGVDYTLTKNTVIGFSWLVEKNIYDGFDSIINPIYNMGGKIDSSIRSFATYYPIAKTNSFNLHADIKLDTSGKMLYLNGDYFKYYRTDSSDFSSHSYGSSGQSLPGSSTRYYDDNKQDIDIYTLKADLEWPGRWANYSFGGKISFINTYSNAFYYNKIGSDSLDYNTNLSNEFNYKENTQSIYGSLNKTMDKWKINVGLRGEYTQTTGYSYTLEQTTKNNYLRFFPTILVSYEKKQGHTISLGINRRINRPTYWNLNPFKSIYSPYSYGEGNPYLQPSYTTNIELSDKYKGLISTLFFNHTKNGFSNLVFASADTNLVFTRPINFLETYRSGLSLGWSGSLTRFWESYELVNLYYTAAISQIPAVEDRKGMGMYISSNNTIYLNTAKSLALAVNFWHQFHEVDRIGRSSNYYKLDIGCRITIKEKLDIGLTLNDALRKSASSLTTRVNGLDQQFINFQFNRYLLLTMNYRFGQKKKDGARSPGNEDERNRLH